VVETNNSLCKSIDVCFKSQKKDKTISLCLLVGLSPCNCYYDVNCVFVVNLVFISFRIAKYILLSWIINVYV